jgi:hypothetical protein
VVIWLDRAIEGIVGKVQEGWRDDIVLAAHQCMKGDRFAVPPAWTNRHQS